MHFARNFVEKIVQAVAKLQVHEHPQAGNLTRRRQLKSHLHGISSATVVVLRNSPFAFERKQQIHLQLSSGIFI
jgi:hypothetical protein